MAGVGLRHRRGARPHEAPRGHRHRGRRVHPSRPSRLGLPGGRMGPVPVHGLPAHPVVRDRLPAGPAPPGEGAPLGRRALRPRRHRRALHRHADGRQRGTARGALRRTGARVRPLGPAVGEARVGRAAAGRGAGAARVLAVVAGRARRDQVPRGPGRQVATTSSRSASTSPPFPTSGGSRSPSPAATGRGRRSRCTRRSPAAGCGSSTRAGTRSSTRADQSAHLRQLAGRERGALRGPAQRQAGQELLRRACADRAAACPTCGCAGAPTTGACSRWCYRPRS